MARFDGKPLISTKVSDGINKAQELIERALSGNAPVYHSKGGATEEGGASADGDTIGRKIYKSLMNGVSHMLPFVIGGGILIALSFLVDGANAGTAAFGSGTPLAKFFNPIIRYPAANPAISAPKNPDEIHASSARNTEVPAFARSPPTIPGINAGLSPIAIAI